METLSLLLGTVLLRPYVFIFLTVYLTIAILNMGVLRSLLFTILSYSIAFACEYSSTRNGFPFGFYTYIDTTRDQELWVSNVPFMDSLSFSFLIYVSYTLSLFLWAPLNRNKWDIKLGETSHIQHSFKVIATASTLCMLMDVIIDPVAFLGDRWFLGKIYFYRESGEYFHIPLTNFAGWIFVASTTLTCFTAINSWLHRIIPKKEEQIAGQALLGPALYFGVLAFNLGVTFYIGEFLLGAWGTLIFSGILALVWFRIQKDETLHGL